MPTIPPRLIEAVARVICNAAACSYPTDDPPDIASYNSGSGLMWEFWAKEAAPAIRTIIAHALDLNPLLAVRGLKVVPVILPDDVAEDMLYALTLKDAYEAFVEMLPDGEPEDA